MYSLFASENLCKKSMTQRKTYLADGESNEMNACYGKKQNTYELLLCFTIYILLNSVSSSLTEMLQTHLMVQFIVFHKF